MSPDVYFKRIGPIVGGFQNLESAIRIYLCRTTKTSHPQSDYASLKVGDNVPDNYFTQFASLGQLVTSYNNSRATKAHQLDPALVHVRDLIAHGRPFVISGIRSSMHLVKFSRIKPRRVEFNERIDENWFLSLEHRLGCAMYSVHASLALIT